MTRPVPFQIYNVTMTGSWVRWKIPNEVNSILVQNRSEVDTKVSMEADGSPYFTIRLKNALVMGSFNTNNQYMWFNASAGTIVEIMTVNLP